MAAFTVSMSAVAAPRVQRKACFGKSVGVSNGTEAKVAMFQIWKPKGNKCAVALPKPPLHFARRALRRQVAPQPHRANRINGVPAGWAPPAAMRGIRGARREPPVCLSQPVAGARAAPPRIGQG